MSTPGPRTVRCEAGVEPCEPDCKRFGREPAPQPSADAPEGRFAAARCGDLFVSSTSLAFAVAAARAHELDCKACGNAAAPSVSGDEAPQALLDKWSVPNGVSFASLIREAYAAGLERGRALVARDADERWLKAATDTRMADDDQGWQEACITVIDVARRSGGQGK